MRIKKQKHIPLSAILLSFLGATACSAQRDADYKGESLATPIASRKPRGPTQGRRRGGTHPGTHVCHLC
jgi:hypothetical protein